MKIFLIIVSFAIMAVNSLSAQTITFSATDNITDEPLEPDSIRVFSDDMIFDTTLVGVNVLDFSPVTWVDDGDMISSGLRASRCRPNAFESSTGFDVQLPQNGNIGIIVSDAMGKKVASYSDNLPSDVYSFRFNAICLPPGLYFISISDGISRQTIKAVKYGAASGDGCSIELSGQSNRKVLPEYPDSYIGRYTFIVYAKSYYPNKKKNMEIWDGKEYRFGLEPLSKWKFSGMKIKAHFNKVVKYTRIQDIADRNNNPDKVYIDTSSFGIYEDFEFYYIKYYSGCHLFYSIQDTIRYCSYNYYQFDDCEAILSSDYKGYKLEFVIDERNNTVKDFSYNSYKSEEDHTTRGTEEWFNICVENMNYKKRKDGGLSIKVNSDGMKTNNSIELNWRYESSSGSRFYISQGASTILDYGDNSFIEIELIP